MFGLKVSFHYDPSMEEICTNKLIHEDHQCISYVWIIITLNSSKLMLLIQIDASRCDVCVVERHPSTSKSAPPHKGSAIYCISGRQVLYSLLYMQFRANYIHSYSVLCMAEIDPEGGEPLDFSS